MIKFKWDTLGYRFHLVGCTIHLLYIVLLFIYIDEIYIYKLPNLLDFKTNPTEKMKILELVGIPLTQSKVVGYDLDSKVKEVLGKAYIP